MFTLYAPNVRYIPKINPTMYRIKTRNDVSSMMKNKNEKI